MFMNYYKDREKVLYNSYNYNKVVMNLLGNIPKAK